VRDLRRGKRVLQRQLEENTSKFFGLMDKLSIAEIDEIASKPMPYRETELTYEFAEEVLEYIEDRRFNEGGFWI